VYRGRDVLNGLLADVTEDDRDLIRDSFVDRAGDANTAGISQAFESRREIHAIAQKLTMALDDICDRYSDSKL
jgi:hypothetical protein